MLGSRKHANIPMTPRTVKGTPGGGGGVDFARQLAERNGAAAGSLAKKFRSAAPKGSRLAAGYRDRTGDRVEEGEGDEKAARIKALEEQVKLGQMERGMFERIRDEVTGGEVENTHLVKGLDWKLLERIKKGEDVLAEKKGVEEGDEEDPEDLDDEFEELEKREVVAVRKEEKEKKGEMAPPPPVAGVKRTRDQILAELKASRKRAAEEVAAQQQLGTKFRRIGGKKDTSRIEIDERGREVLIVTDADGHERRKVRKGRLDGAAAQSSLLMPDIDATPLGMEVPEIPQAPAEESDDDIYADIGDDYDPLASIGEDELSSSDEEVEVEARPKIPEKPKNILEEAEQTSEPDTEQKSSAEPPNPPTTALPRNYFNDAPNPLSVLSNAANPFQDPTYLAALLQKSKDTASATDPSSASSLSAEPDQDRLKRRAAMLSAQDRDLDDVDMGFGSSRFDDADDMAMDGSRVKLSEWGDKSDDGDEAGREKGDKGPRKRGPKKRKGDKNSVADVLGAIQRRKK
jgi:hypothetical protein